MQPRRRQFQPRLNNHLIGVGKQGQRGARGTCLLPTFHANLPDDTVFDDLIIIFGLHAFKSKAITPFTDKKGGNWMTIKILCHQQTLCSCTKDLTLCFFFQNQSQIQGEGGGGTPPVIIIQRCQPKEWHGTWDWGEKKHARRTNKHYKLDSELAAIPIIAIDVHP